MAGGSKSSSSQATTTTDQSAIVEDEGINAVDGSTVNVERIEDDVVDLALDFGREALGLGGGVIGKALDFGLEAIEAVKDTSQDAIAELREDKQNEITKGQTELIEIWSRYSSVIVIGLIVGGVWAMRKE